MLYFRPDPLPASKKKKKPGKRTKQTQPKDIKTSLTAGDKVLWNQRRNTLSLQREGGTLLWANLEPVDHVTFRELSQFNDACDLMAAAALEALYTENVGNGNGDIIVVEFLDAR